jgi:hypothetical protein
MLEPHDDLRHDIGDDPEARESIAWNLVFPEHDVFGFGYFTRKANDESTRILGLFDPDGGITMEAASDQPLEGTDLDDFTVDGMHIAQPDRLSSMTVSFAGERLSLDYSFAAMHEAWSYAHHGDGCPSPVATNRFEQCGRIRGTLTIDGQEIPFDTTGHRDHSWGVRDYDAIIHWNWVSAQAGPDLSIHANHTWFQGKQYTNGYVFRDGTLSPVVDLKIRASYDEQLRPLTAEFQLLDEAGRTTAAESEYFAGGFVAPFGDFVWSETGCRFSLEGQDGVGMFEQGWQAADIEHLRAGRRVETP